MPPDPTRRPQALPPLRDGASSPAAMTPLMSPSTPTSLGGRGGGGGGGGTGFNPLSSKVTTVLSTSYADSEFREALALLDARGVENTAETRRQLRLDLQKEVIDSNGDVVDEFGKVAEQLRHIGSIVDKLNAVHADMRGRITAAHEATAGVLEEASSLMAQKRQVETKQNLLRAFKANFVLSEDEIALLTLTSEPVDDGFFAVVSKAKQIIRDCEVLLGFEKQTLGLEIMEQTTKNLNMGFQKLYRWIQREFKGLNLENPQIGAAIRRALRVLAERPTLFQNCLSFFAEAREHILSDAFYTALTGSSAAGAGAGAPRESTSVKPIELVAHDPLRYVGDMLAWAHSAAVGEREALEVLFVSEGDEIAKGIRAGRENEAWRFVADNDDDDDDEGDGGDGERKRAEAAAEFDPVTALNELVDRDMSGAARILRQRVEQVIQTNEETILAYKLANLLDFYKATFAKLLGGGDGSVLVECLAGLETEALRQFRSLVRDHIATLQGEFQQTPADLGAPDFLQDALEQLTAIMQTYETSFAVAAADREADFQPTLAEAFDPFLAGCENMATTQAATAVSLAGSSTSRSSSDDAETNATIFLINCLLSAQRVLARFDFAQGRARQLAARVETESARLADSQYRFLRTASGLDALISLLAPLDREKPADVARVVAAATASDSKSDSEIELEVVLGPAALTRAGQTLDNFLPSALMDAMERVRHLQDARLAREITESAAERFCVDFEHVEGLLAGADDAIAEREGRSRQGVEEGEEDGEEEQQGGGLRALFPRTTGEIRVLLS